MNQESKKVETSIELAINCLIAEGYSCLAEQVKDEYDRLLLKTFSVAYLAEQTDLHKDDIK